MAKCKVDPSKCMGCGSCMASCPHGAIEFSAEGKAVINENKCQGCGTCVQVCPCGAISQK